MADVVGHVKGASFIKSWERLHALEDSGRVSSEALQVALSAEAIALYEDKVVPSLWYPLTAVDELSHQIVELEGKGDPTYMRTIGEEALGAFLERDSYRSFIEGAMKQKGSEGQTLVQLASLVYDFGAWSYAGDDLSDFTLTIHEAEVMPTLALQSIAGFVRALVRHCTGIDLDVSLERPSQGTMIFTARAVR